MFLVNILTLDGADIGNFLPLLLYVVLVAAWLIGVLLMAWKLSNTTNPDVEFLCKTGLHICYILFISVVFMMWAPIWVSNMVEAGNIALADASICTAGIIVAYMLILNAIGIVFATCWHFTKKRKEMSELDRMKLADI